MTIAWRFVKVKHVPGAFDGEGARRYGGRWNRKGITVVYVSESIALASLEEFVHVGYEGRKIEYAYIKVVIPDEVNIDTLKSLPADWRESPPPVSTQDIGTAWVQEGTSAVLKIPSAIIPVEFNYMFNIFHPDFRKIKTDKPVPFNFDLRMWKA